MRSLTPYFISLDTLQEQDTVKQLLNTNREARQYGLTLSPADVAVIVEARTQALRNYERVELGSEVIGRLATTFCSSPFLNQAEYAATVAELVEAFYYLKNETLDRISDNELISTMRVCFDRCSGSLELMWAGELEQLVREIRSNYYAQTGIEKDVES